MANRVPTRPASSWLAVREWEPRRGIVSILLASLLLFSVAVGFLSVAGGHLVGVSSAPSSSRGPAREARSNAVSTAPDWTVDPTLTGPGGLFDVSLASNPSDGTVLLFGGCSQVICSKPSNETMEFVGGQWVLLHPANSPPGREYGTMVYDAAEGYFLLYGGESASGTLNDTWTFSDGNWQELTETTNPGPRSQANMAYDAADGTAIIFGGYACFAYCGGTWAFSGGSWKNVTYPGAPPARYASMMAYDSAVGGVILYGGVGSATGDYLSDTWEYKSGNWTQLALTGPPQRESGAMGYDPALSAAILEGGDYVTLNNFPGVTYVDTWEFTASGWTELSPLHTAAGGTDGAMTYDPSSGEMLEFGGCTETACPNSFTYEFGNSSELTAYVQPASCGSIGLGGYSSLPNGSSQLVPPGSYQIVAPTCSNYTFAHWSTSGLASLNNTTSTSVTINVTGTSNVTASYSAVTPTGQSPTGSGHSSSGGGFPLLYLAAGVAAAVVVVALLVVFVRRRRPPPSTTPEPRVPVGEAPPTGPAPPFPPG